MSPPVVLHQHNPDHEGEHAHAAPAAPTLADVVAHIAAAALTAQRKGEIISAVNSTALWLQRTPGEIPANYEYLRRAFERLNFGTLGVGRARFRNVQSLVKQGLAISGVSPSGETYLAPMTPAWAALRDGRLTRQGG